MKASVYYQDLGLNSCVFGNNEKLRLDTLHASFIGEVVIGIEDKIAFADKVFRILNTEPETLFSQDKFKEIGHTSMSVGDYLYFEEDNTQTILICASCGWKVLDDEFLKRRDKVIDTIYSLPIGTIEGMYREIEKDKNNEVSNILSDTFLREKIKCENYCPHCGADENDISWGSLDILSEILARNSTCLKCRTNFTEYYTYSETQIDEIGVIPKERDTWQQTEILQHKINYNFYQEGLTLNEMDIEHITDLIKDGYIEGELCQDGVDGYWEIEK